MFGLLTYDAYTSDYSFYHSNIFHLFFFFRFCLTSFFCSVRCALVNDGESDLEMTNRKTKITPKTVIAKHTQMQSVFRNEKNTENYLVWRNYTTTICVKCLKTKLYRTVLRINPPAESSVIAYCLLSSSNIVRILYDEQSRSWVREHPIRRRKKNKKQNVLEHVWQLITLIMNIMMFSVLIITY